MKKVFILLYVLLFAGQVFADTPIIRGSDGQNIIIKKKGIGHLENYIPFDQPDVYYDDDNFQIIIDGGGEVTYYDVQITSMTTWYVVISTVVSGYYDTIDVSSLATGDYIITISSPTGNEFEGEFTIN